jgi:arsenite methyltransferase
MSDAPAALPESGAAIAADELKSCCASLYEHPATRWLLGGDLHPGGQRATRRALELIGLRPGERMLDVASGTGDSAILATREFGAIAAGVDYGSHAVRDAQARADAAGLCDRVGFVVGDAEALPFGDAEFDAVLCECSLCVFPDKERALGEIHRVLRPGGRLALADVVVDRNRLPERLDGALAAIACIGEALSRREYWGLLGRMGFGAMAYQWRGEDAAALAERVHDRLRGARLLNAGREGAALPVGVEEAIELVQAARGAIADGALGYAIFAVSR